MGNDNITNAAIPSKIKLQNNDEFLSRKSIQIAIPIDQSEGTSQMLLYKMYWKTPSDNLIFSIMNAVNHLNHLVYVRRKHPPTDDTYDWIKQIDQGDWLTSDQIKITVGGGLYTEPANVYIGVLIYLGMKAFNLIFQFHIQTIKEGQILVPGHVNLYICPSDELSHFQMIFIVRSYVVLLYHCPRLGGGLGSC